MKKVMAIFGAALLLASVATSCNKKCECKTYVNGALSYTADPFEVETGKKCSDYNSSTTVLGVTTEVKCSSKF